MFRIWTNAGLSPESHQQLRQRLAGHELLLSQSAVSNLSGASDPQLATADIAYGQPDPAQIIALPNLKWIHLTSTGYTRYERPDLIQALRNRGAMLTNSSAVYAEPCAQHVFAMMMALGRCLPQSLYNQRTTRAWPQGPIRQISRIMEGQLVLIYGYGAIAARLVELLAPLKMDVKGIRRRPRGDEPIPMLTPDQADAWLAKADHIVNILPSSPETDGFFNATRMAKFNPQAHFYNIGRGSTIDQSTLQQMLTAGHLAGAYLDVMTPEPLPPDSPLWQTPNCYLTPHTAGGHTQEFHRLVNHFLANLDRFANAQPLLDRVY